MDGLTDWEDYIDSGFACRDDYIESDSDSDVLERLSEDELFRINSCFETEINIVIFYSEEWRKRKFLTAKN